VLIVEKKTLKTHTKKIQKMKKKRINERNEMIEKKK
jgi:hypothetical protein